MRASPSWRTGKALVFERVTPFFTLLSNRLPNAVGCEYLSEFADPGTELLFKGVRVRHEDMLRLSFPDETFDAIYHGDVLEHVPDMTKALQECYRALKQEGELLFTLPFYSERESTITRAKIVDGTRIDIHPPAYHGNPLSAEGALVYSEPGLEFFNQVSSIGDWATEIGLAYSIADGYFSDAHRNPKSRCFNVVFRCRKGKRH